MVKIPSYPKIPAYGNPGTGTVFDGPVLVQEKLDGSQIGFGYDSTCDIGVRSHNVQLNLDDPPKMFRAGVNSILENLSVQFETAWFYGEYFGGRKQNTIAYDSIPDGHIALFDAVIDGEWIDYDQLAAIAKEFNFGVVPVLAEGTFGGISELSKFLEMTSVLGGSQVEGVVIKNYGQRITLDNKICPAMAKLVRDEFKEKNSKAWAKPNVIQVIIESLTSEARYLKVVQSLRESGELTNSVKDIGPLIKQANLDINEEESEWIKEQLYRAFRKQIVKSATKGLPTWYKAYLAEQIEQ